MDNVWRWMVGFIPWLFTPWYALSSKQGGPRNQSGFFLLKTFSCSFQKLEQHLGCPAYILDTIRSDLSCLWTVLYKKTNTDVNTFKHGMSNSEYIHLVRKNYMKFNQNTLVSVVIRQWAGYLSGVSGFGSWQGHRFFPFPQYPHLGGLSASNQGVLTSSFPLPQARRMQW